MKKFLFILLNLISLYSIVSAQVTLGNNKGNVYDFCISKDGNKIYIPSNNQIEVWNTQTYALEETLTIADRGKIIFINLNSEGNNIATSFNDSTIRIYDLNTKYSNLVLRNEGMTTYIKFSPDDRKLASVTTDKTIVIWDLDSSKPESILFGHNNDITDIEFVDNNRLLSCSADHSIILWDIQNEMPVAKCIASKNWIRDLSINASRTKIVSCGDDGNIQLWYISDNKSFRLISKTKFCFNWIMSVDFLDEETYVFSGHNKMVNIRSYYANYSYKLSSYINKVAFIPEKKSFTVAIATQGNGLIIVDSKKMHRIE